MPTETRSSGYAVVTPNTPDYSWVKDEDEAKALVEGFENKHPMVPLFKHFAKKEDAQEWLRGHPSRKSSFFEFAVTESPKKSGEKAGKWAGAKEVHSGSDLEEEVKGGGQTALLLAALARIEKQGKSQEQESKAIRSRMEEQQKEILAIQKAGPQKSGKTGEESDGEGEVEEEQAAAATDPKALSNLQVREMAARLEEEHRLETSQVKESGSQGLQEARRSAQGNNASSVVAVVGYGQSQAVAVDGVGKARLEGAAEETLAEGKRRRERVLEQYAEKIRVGSGDTYAGVHPFDNPLLRVTREEACRGQFKPFELDLGKTVKNIRGDGLVVARLDGIVYRYKLPSLTEIKAKSKNATKRTVSHLGLNPYLELSLLNPDGCELVKYGAQMVGEREPLYFPATFALLYKYVDSTVREGIEGNSLLAHGNRRLLPESQTKRTQALFAWSALAKKCMSKYDTAPKPIAQNENKVVIQFVMAVFIVQVVSRMALAPGDTTFEIANGTDRMQQIFEDIVVVFLNKASVPGSEEQKRAFIYASQGTGMACSMCDAYPNTLETCINLSCVKVREGGDDPAAKRKLADDQFEKWKRNLPTGAPAPTTVAFEFYMRMVMKTSNWTYPPKPSAAAPSSDPFARFAACQHLIPCPRVEGDDSDDFL
jgi:hypothetical protein